MTFSRGELVLETTAGGRRMTCIEIGSKNATSTTGTKKTTKSLGRAVAKEARRSKMMQRTSRAKAVVRRHYIITHLHQRVWLSPQ